MKISEEKQGGSILIQKRIKISNKAYKEIRSLTRSELEEYLNDIYFNAHDAVINYVKIYQETGKVDGIDESRLNEIMTILENALDEQRENILLFSYIIHK